MHLGGANNKKGPQTTMSFAKKNLHLEGCKAERDNEEMLKRQRRGLSRCHNLRNECGKEGKSWRKCFCYCDCAKNRARMKQERKEAERRIKNVRFMPRTVLVRNSEVQSEAS